MYKYTLLLKLYQSIKKRQNILDRINIHCYNNIRKLKEDGDYMKNNVVDFNKYKKTIETKKKKENIKKTVETIYSYDKEQNDLSFI